MSFKRWPSLRTSLVAGVGVLGVIGLIVACGDTNPGAGAPATNPNLTGSCATPNIGCPCDAPGTKVACGKKVTGDLNFIYCMEGTRACGEDGRWGDCGDGTLVTKAVSHTKIAGLGALPSSCTGGLSGNTLSVCVDGRKQGEFCATNGDCADGKRKCGGTGTDKNKDCHDDDDCQDICVEYNGHCKPGSPSPNIGCDSDADCGGGAGDCQFDGGHNCGSFTGLCESTDPFLDGEACNADADCGVGGQCKKQKFGLCIGGKHNGGKCKDTKHCQSGKGGGGVCSNEVAPDAGLPPIDPCDPYCTLYSDTADGIDAGLGFVVGDGGITGLGCGDGLLLAPEGCDDGNTTAGDGCDATCKLEPGYQCPTPGSPCIAAVCGNGVQEGLEQCDDTPTGNTDRPYDGCYQCKFEVVCPPGGPCTARCGDGVVMGSETCDDGNTISGDGCSSSCAVETGATCTNSTTALTPTIDVPVIYRDFVGYGQQAGTYPAGVTAHPDFEHNAPHAGITGYTGYPCVSTAVAPATHKGIMNDTLGADNEPYARSPVATGYNECSTASIYQWYHDDPTVNKVILGKYIRLFQQGGPMGTTYQFEANTSATSDTVTTPGVNCGSSAASPNNSCKGLAGFWPINGDGFGPFLSTQSVKNFHFTSEVHIPFTYKGGEKLDFTGDDDVFVYVAGRKVVDLGGIHGAINGSVTLPNASPYSLNTTAPDNNSFTLTPGQTYEIAVFQAERNTTGSNYLLTLQGFTRQTTSCTVPVPPSVFTRDYQAVCGAGTQPTWSVFQWKGTIAGASTIQFRAATADTQALLPASKTDPSTVAIGTATAANSSPLAWAYDPCTAKPCSTTTPTPVSADLKAAGQTSKSWLRVYMTFNAGAILNEWAMLYDCIPVE